MSKRLTYEVGASRHPLLMDDRVARDVLWWMANAARESNGCRIIETVETFAHRCDRSISIVRDAQKRLKKAGLIEEQGRGDFNARVIVYTIAENVLIDSPRLDMSEPEEESTPRNDSGSGMLTGASIVSESWADREGIVSESWGNREGIVSPTRARALNKNKEQDQHQECAGTPAPEHAEGNGEAKPVEKVEKPYTLPAHPVADAMLAQHNAAAMAQRAKASSRKPVVAEQAALPIATTPEPVPVVDVEADTAPKLSPGDARVAAAIEEAWAIIAPKGQTPATLTTWRARLRSRLTAKGVSAEAVADRLEAVKRAWAYINANGWHIQEKRNGPGHFFGVTLRSDEGLDKTAASKPEPLRGKGGQVARPWSAAGLPTAADVVASIDAEAEAREIARLEAEAEAQRARIAAVAPKPAPVEAKPAPAVERVADPERIKAAFGEMSGMLGSFGMGRGTRPMPHNARNGAGVGAGKGEA